MKTVLTLMLGVVAVLVALAPSAAQAQTVYNPRVVQFDSPDHVTGVSAYKVELWLSTADPVTGAPISTYDLAKTKVTATSSTPAYQANLTDVTPLFSYPVGQTYVVRLIAVGVDPAMLSARSTPSNPFAAADAPRSLVNVSVR